MPAVPTAPPGVTPARPGARPAARAWRWLAIGLSAALVVVAGAMPFGLSSRLATSRVAGESYRAAVAQEAGVRPLVSDRVGELGTVESVTVRRTPDGDAARVHLLGPVGEARARVAVVWSAARPRFAIDGRLGDGRPYQIRNDDPDREHASLFTVGADGGNLEVIGRMTFAELLAVMDDVAVGSQGVVRRPSGWVAVADGPMPPWRDGMSTVYEFLGGRRLVITVEPATPGREALAAFGGTERIDIGIGDWAYRYLPPHAGMLVQIDDVVVDLVGNFSDPELMTVAYSLRAMRPGEHPIAPPERD